MRENDGKRKAARVMRVRVNGKEEKEKAWLVIRQEGQAWKDYKEGKNNDGWKFGRDA